jgi:hypothetical protein
MPKTKPNKGKHFVADVRQMSGPNAPRSANAARARRIREAMRALVGTDLIYAIRCHDGLIKIGHTRNLVDRRGHLNTAHDAILSVEPASFEEEQRLHGELRDSVGRAREYYHPTPEVLAYVNGVREKLGVGLI